MKVLFALLLFNGVLCSQTNQLIPFQSWEGSVSDYVFIDDQLKLRADEAGEESLSKKVVLQDTCVWNLSFVQDFSPSTSNQYRIYFMSNNQVDSVVTEALYIEVGESGTSDGVNLFKVIKGETTLVKKLYEGEFSESGAEHAILLTKSSDNYTLFVNDHIGFDFTYATSSVLFKQNHVAVFNKFTKSNVAGFCIPYFNFGSRAFDELSIKNIWYDEKGKELVVAFSQSLVGLDTVLTQGVFLEQMSSVNFAADSMVIKLNTGFLKEQLIQVELNFESSYGEGVELSGEFWVYKVDPFDVIFSEIMFDYTSNTGFLHQGQYVELHNRASHPVNLEMLHLLVGDDKVVLPSYNLVSGGFVVLMKDSIKATNYLNVVPVPEWSGLSTTSARLSLVSNDILVDDMVYDKDLLNQSFKQEGGWSIELLDMESYCLGKGIWGYAVDEIGGTPGKLNSAHFEAHFDVIKIEELYFKNDTQLSVVFNAKLSSKQVVASNFICVLGVLNVVQHAHQLSGFTLTFSNKMEVGKEYSLQLKDIAACIGGDVEQELVYAFGIPEAPTKLDIIINEILPDANSTDEEYIEIYNNSDKIIDLSQLLLGKISVEGVLEETHEIASNQKMLSPGDYLCLTKDIEEVKKNYLMNNYNASANIMMLNSFPNLVADNGVVALVDRTGEVIDAVNYDGSWHSDLLADTKGVSLERIYFSRASNASSNWVSSSFDVNYGTPGYANSNANIENDARGVKINTLNLVKDFIHLNAADENLTLAYQFEHSNYALTGVVYSSGGMKLGMLCENVLLGASGELSFDFTELELYPLTKSVYVVLFEAIHPTQKKIVLKQSVSVY
ncbi:MAG: hypothetical protein ACJAZ2_001656 [Glaciecola sp.]|jgi:hypothetical protein